MMWLPVFLVISLVDGTKHGEVKASMPEASEEICTEALTQDRPNIEGLVRQNARLFGVAPNGFRLAGDCQEVGE